MIDRSLSLALAVLGCLSQGVENSELGV